jgi:hypothetical protein
MSDRTFTAGETTTTREMWRRDSSGRLVLVEPQPNEYCSPPKGSRGRFRLNGLSPVYTYNSPTYGEQKRVRVEYQILKLPNTPDLEGMKFTQGLPWPKNISDDRAKLGQLLTALLGRKFAPGEAVNPDDYISSEFVTSTTRDENGDKVYSGISWETIDPSKTKLSPYVNGAQPQPELAGVAVGSTGDEDDDPFRDGDDL